MARSEAHVEAEIKAPLADPDEFRARLLEMGASPAGSVRQIDRYYDHPARDFGETDEALRLREQSGATRLTYKGPRLDPETKSRSEYDVGVDSPEKMDDVLECLGFEKAAEIVKDREMLTLDEITATIDEVEGLGTYTELERRVEEEDFDEARKQLLDMAEELGLDDLERRSYLELKIEKERKEG